VFAQTTHRGASRMAWGLSMGIRKHKEGDEKEFRSEFDSE
jgi:hypothetical protein